MSAPIAPSGMMGSIAENWTATELLPKIDVPIDLLTHIKTSVGEEMFNNFRLYYGDDPERYNLSFEAIFGTYCNKIEWVQFLRTPLATAAHAIAFHDLNKLTAGKMLFYIQVPRVAKGTGMPVSRQSTIMVSKYTEKSPITIAFELSAATLNHLRETFEDTLLDRLLNADAINTVLRVVKNTADAMERGLVDCFVRTLLRHAPPCSVLRTLAEHSHLSRRRLTRVERSSVLQGFKAKLLGTIFLIDRSRERATLSRYLSLVTDAVTESILDDPSTYVTTDGHRLAGVLLSTPTVIQVLLNALGADIRQVGVRAPAAYGKFVLSRENAVTAIAHHAIMADFAAQAARVGESSQADLPESQFLDQKPGLTELPMTVLRIGERHIALDHLRRVYKNTDAQDPLERTVELTFYFPLGLHVAPGRGYTTAENKIRLAETAETALPTSVYFYNKDHIPQRLDFSDALRTLCHPVIYDAGPCLAALTESGPPEGDDRVRHLCHREYPREGMANATRRLLFFYQARREPPRTFNEVKHDFPTREFPKPDNYALFTELHPYYDFFFEMPVDGDPLGPGGGPALPFGADRAVARCTPRVLVGNLPEALAPPSFHELRARQCVELLRLRPPEDHEAAFANLRNTLTDAQYPEICYLLDLLIHGEPEAFAAARPLVTRIVNNYWRLRGHLAFAHSYDLIHLIATHLGDGSGIQPAAHALYRTLDASVRYIARTMQLNGLNARLADEPLLAYVNALFDPRLWPPIVSALPRARHPCVRLVADRDPLEAAQIETREPAASDVARMLAADQAEPLFADARRLSDEEWTLHKVFYLCVLPAVTNNRACGLGLTLKSLVVDLFYDATFLVPDPADPASMAAAATGPLHELLAALLRDVATDERVPAAAAAQELFALLPWLPEHAQVLEVRAALDPAQRHGAPAAAFESLQHVLYNGCAAVTAPRLLAAYAVVVPFHRFYSDPTLAATLNRDIRVFLNDFPHLQRNDGGFPLSPLFAHEYQHWHRTPFSCFTAGCAPTLNSALTLGAMHHKFSPVAVAALSRLGVHPGFALTLVRTDSFQTDTLLYSAKASNALIINTPTVTKEDRDINTVFHVAQNINSVDMALGYGSASCVAHLRRSHSDMGARVADLFQVFPMQTYRNEEVDAWVRQTTGSRRTELMDADAISVLTFGRQTDKGGPSLLHGQRATCEAVLTPVSAELEFFRYPNNPRGRSSCMLGVDPYDDAAARAALYDHVAADPQTFLVATQNPWASQRGSLGDIMYNTRSRERLGFNPSFYSPCAQFFTAEDVIASNQTLFRTIDEYLLRSLDCIHADPDLQYIRVEGTDSIVEKPCKFLQEALSLQTSTTQALLEAQQKGAAPGNLNETHFGNYSIAEILPLQRSILFNS